MRIAVAIAACLLLAAPAFAAEPLFKREEARPPNPANVEKIFEIARNANAAYKAGRWREAADGYRKITFLDPGSGLAWYFLGTSLRAVDSRGAMDALQKAMHTLEYGSERYWLADRAYSELRTKGDKAAVAATGPSGASCSTEFASACQARIARDRSMMESLGGAYNGPSADDCAANASRNLVRSISVQETPDRVRVLFGTLKDTPEAIECAVRAVQAGPQSALENKNSAVNPSHAVSNPPPASKSTPGEAVQDLNTGLLWKRCFEGQSLAANSCSGEPARYTFEEAKKLQVAGWRLPTLDEINALTPTLLDRARLPDGRTLEYVPSSQLTDNGVEWYSGRIGDKGWIGGVPTSKRAIRLVRSTAPSTGAAPVQRTDNPTTSSTTQPDIKGPLALDVLFAAGSNKLTPEATHKLDTLAGDLTKAHVEVVIAVGYTDKSDGNANTASFSTQRAEAVKQYLISKGIEANRIYAEGKGQLDASGTAARNRRVAIEAIAK